MFRSKKPVAPQLPSVILHGWTMVVGDCSETKQTRNERIPQPTNTTQKTKEKLPQNYIAKQVQEIDISNLRKGKL